MWDDNLVRMNENKKGKKYKFPDSFILVIRYITEYIFTYLLDKHRRNHKSHWKRILPDHPSYSQICRRINKLNIPSNRLDDDDGGGGGKDDDKKHYHSNIAMDSTCIKVTDRGR